MFNAASKQLINRQVGLLSTPQTLGLPASGRTRISGTCRALKTAGLVQLGSPKNLATRGYTHTRQARL
jgi:hypothetical protein